MGGRPLDKGGLNMGCKKIRLGDTSCQLSDDREQNLNETGRLQYFYHSPSSLLPIRDVLNEQRQGYKKEPHIEIGAENYWASCYQNNNIKPFIKNKEKYLFLMTTCRNAKLRQCGKKVIVGYISRKLTEIHEGRSFVKGDIFLYPFKDAIPIAKMGYSEHTTLKKVDEDHTKNILNHFKDKINIVSDCIKEIKAKDKDNRTCPRLSEGSECQYRNECSRFLITHKKHA